MSQNDIENFELNVYKTQLVAHQLISSIMNSKAKMPQRLRDMLYSKCAQNKTKHKTQNKTQNKTKQNKTKHNNEKSSRERTLKSK